MTNLRVAHKVRRKAGTGWYPPYITSFPLTENPISEGGKWINGLTTGLDWSDVRTVSGIAYNDQTKDAHYNDAT